MRPTWLTIAVVPAFIAAVVGASTTGILLRLVPSYTQRSEKADPAEKTANKEALPAKEKPVSTPVEASEHPQLSKPQNATSAKEESLKKESDPWWATLIDHVAWPVTILAALIFIAYNSRLGRILGLGTRLVKKISAGGVDIEINSETVELVQRQLHDTFTELVNGAGDEYDRIAQIQDVPELLKNTIVALVPQGVASLRGVIHVNDVIFPDYFYQLVDYYPIGGGADRRFSLRYGIIGRTWRSRKSHGTGDAFAGAGGSIEALVENWGMTEEEAHGQINGRPSCLSVLVKCKTIPVGVLFIDSTARNAFGDDAAALALAQRIEASDEVATLGEAISKTLAPLRTAAPSLKIKGPAK